MVQSLEEGRLAEPRPGRGEFDWVPSAHAHLHNDGTDDAAAGVSRGDPPILLPEIDQLLGDSAGVENVAGAAAIRFWRDELTLALESLTYARSILACDVGILRHCLATEGSDGQTLVDKLPKLMASSPWGEPWSPACQPEDHADRAVFVRCDQLMSAHLEMARTDLSSPEDVKRLLGRLEQQLAGLTDRQDAVEVRLKQIRVVIVRQYHQGVVPTRNWAG